MRLRRKVNKKAAALAIAAAVAVSVPVSASAVEYEAKDGTVTVTKEEDSTKLSESSGTNAKSYQTDENNSSYDKDITIKGDNSDKADTDKTIVDVKNGVEGANITIKDVKAETNNEGSAAIEIGDNVKADVTINNVEITLGKTGEDENVANNQNGIRVGEGSDVTINVEGNNTIQGASSTTADDIVGSVTTAHKLLNGVVVGGGGEDGAGDGKGTKVEITSDSAEGGTLTIKATPHNEVHRYRLEMNLSTGANLCKTCSSLANLNQAVKACLFIRIRFARANRIFIFSICFCSPLYRVFR